MRLAVHPGPGLVARSARSALLVLGTDGSDPIASDLVAACSSAESSGDRLRELAEGPARGVHAFCALVQGDAEVELYVHGRMKVTVVTETSRLELATTDEEGWLEETFRSRLISVTASEKAVKGIHVALFDLIEGVVPASAMQLVVRGVALAADAAKPPRRQRVAPGRSAPAPVAQAPAEPPPEAQPEPAPAPAPAADAEPAPAATPAAGSEAEPAPAAPPAAEAEAEPEPAPPPAPQAEAEPEPAPLPAPQAEPEPAPPGAGDATVRTPTLEPAAESAPSASRVPELAAAEVTEPASSAVEGRLCPNGHLNQPTLDICRVCGLPVAAKPVSGERPPLGRLVGPAGFERVVDGNLVLGRRAHQAPEVLDGRYAAAEPPQETAAAVSRVHAEIRVDGWSVLLADRGSANGTFVRPPGQTEWIRLQQGDFARLEHGCGIRLGSFEMTFEPA